MKRATWNTMPQDMAASFCWAQILSLLYSLLLCQISGTIIFLESWDLQRKPWQNFHSFIKGPSKFNLEKFLERLRTQSKMIPFSYSAALTNPQNTLPFPRNPICRNFRPIESESVVGIGTHTEEKALSSWSCALPTDCNLWLLLKKTKAADILCPNEIRFDREAVSGDKSIRIWTPH